MVQAIYWILAIAVMLVLLITVIYGLIDRIKTNKTFKEINKKQLEWIDKQIKSLEEMEREDK